MARIRTIKPAFWTHPVLARLPDDTQLLAIAVLSMADDHGYFRADPAIVRGEVMPFRENLARISECLQKLSEVGFIEFTMHPEQGTIGRITKWADHQKVDHARDSKLKAYFFRESFAKPREKIPQEVEVEVDMEREEGRGANRAEESFTLDAAVSYVLIETGLAGRKIRDVVNEVIHREIKKVGMGPKDCAEVMIESWRKYNNAELSFKYGPENFFGTGMWRKPESEWGRGETNGKRAGKLTFEERVDEELRISRGYSARANSNAS